MSHSSRSTGSISALFADLRNGVPGSRNALLEALRQDLTRLTVAILRQFPIVEQRREADSLYQQLNEKLIGALDAGVQPANPAEFVRLAAHRLRCLLIDEAEKLRRRGPAVGVADGSPSELGPGHGLVAAPAAGEDSVSVLLQWAEFQARVQQLDDTERLVFDLHFHMQMPQSEIAELLKLPAKAVSRTWLGVAKKLKGVLPKVEEPPAVLIVSGGTAFTAPAAGKLFGGWRALRVRAVGHADGGPLPAGPLEWAEVIAVTRPAYEKATRANPASAGKRVVVLDVPDQFDPANPADVDRLWQSLMNRAGE